MLRSVKSGSAMVSLVKRYMIGYVAVCSVLLRYAGLGWVKLGVSSAMFC